MLQGWHGWVGTFTGVALITVAVLPLAALTVWALARRRGATGTTAAWQMSLAEVGIAYGTVPWVWMIMIRKTEPRRSCCWCAGPCTRCRRA
ncbi:hypothetical protein Misp04_11860 [Micromonospora sp. NBRC 101691]|nr:hypothetical protein Misp04_11860 [Micromonospora sp. NBRC 101691]